MKQRKYSAAYAVGALIGWLFIVACEVLAVSLMLMTSYILITSGTLGFWQFLWLTVMGLGILTIVRTMTGSNKQTP